MIKLQAYGQKDVGQVRELNEDEFFLKIVQSSDEEPVGLFIVADGIGGQEGGELASEWAVKTLREELRELFVSAEPLRTRKLSTAALEPVEASQTPPTRKLADRDLEDTLRRAIQRANDVVLSIARAKPATAGDTGTTVTMAVVKGEMAYVANVGDSRTYLYRNGELRTITEDHSLVASLVKAGQIKTDEVYTHPQRNLIYRSLGGKRQVEVDVFYQPLQPGDQLLLCSDGLWEMVRDPQIARILGKAPSPEAACQRLVEAANKNGGQDNIGVVVVWIQ